MSSAGKWVLGLLLLVVGAVAVARTVSNDDGSQADVKNLPAAQSAAAASAAAAADSAAKKAATPATDLACKKACVEEPELAEGAVNTRQIAPGSVTLSKLAFEVPNLNELENEINARKAAEAAAVAARDSLASETAKNDAAITAAAQNGLTAEAAARTAAIDKVNADVAAADAALLGSLNKEIADRTAADDALQLNLNTEIAARQAAVTSLRGELADGTEVASPIIQINNNEIVGNAITSNKIKDGEVTSDDILDETIMADDLAVGSVTTAEILNDTILHEDIANGAVRSEEILDNTIVHEDINTGAVRSDEILNDTILHEDINTGAVRSDEILNETILTEDIATGAVTTDKIAPDTILAGDIAVGAVTTDEILANTILIGDLDQVSISTIFATDAELASEAANRAAGDAAEATTRAAFDSSLATQVNGGSPNSVTPGDALVEWSRLKGVPAGFEDNVDDDGNGKVQEFANELKNNGNGDTTINEAGDDVSWFKLRQVPTSLSGATDTSLGCTLCVANTALAGSITADKLSGGITGTLITDGSITAADLAGAYAGGDPTGLQSVVGAVTSEKIADGAILGRDIADGAIDFAKLDTVLQGRITSLEDQVADLAQPLSTPGTSANTVDFSRITNAPVVTRHTASNAATLPIAAGTKVAVVLPNITGATPGDSISVAPPPLAGNIIFAGAAISDVDEVTVYLYNPGPASSDLAATDVFEIFIRPVG